MNSLKYVWIAPATLVYHLFDDPAWFKEMGAKGYPLYLGGLGVVWTVNMLIVLSTFAFCLESLPAFCTARDNPHCTNTDPEFWADVWLYIETGCVMVFTGDFLTRMICCIIMGSSDFKRFRTDPMNYVDVVAVFPFYIQLALAWIFPAECVAIAAEPHPLDVTACAAIPDELLMDASACNGVPGAMSTDLSPCQYTPAMGIMDLRFVRVIRLARVLQSLPDKYSGMGGIVVDIFKTAYMPLTLPLYFMFLGSIVFASLTYYAEVAHNQICYFDGDTSNGASCSYDSVAKDWLTPEGDIARAGENCNAISDWDTFTTTPGNAGCETESGCKCGCNVLAHTYNRAYMYYNFCSLHGRTNDNLEQQFASGNQPTCESWEGTTESSWGHLLPNVTGTCNGVITYETYDSAFHPAEYTSDMFHADGGSGIMTAMWWVGVTFTTVGYGDMNPRTPQGQIVAVLTMVCGVFFLAMPLAVVGGSFQSAWARAEAEHEASENEKNLAIAQKNGEAPPPAIPTSREEVDRLYGDKSERALQDVKGYIAAMLAKSEHLRELAGGLEEHPDIWKKMQAFQLDLKKISQTLGDDSTIVTESFIGDAYGKRDENGVLKRGTVGKWWGKIPDHVTIRSHLMT